LRSCSSRKSPLWLRIKASGAGGHASEPLEDSAPNRIVQAAHRLLEWKREIRLTPAVREWFLRRADLEAEPYQSLYAHIEETLAHPYQLKILLKRQELLPLLQDTLALTVLRGGEKVNVIPEKAELEVDCRLLPDEDPKIFLQELRRTLNDPSLEIEVLLSETSVSSPVDTLLWHAIEKTAQAYYPGIPAIPELLTSSTDSHYFREVGIVAYGFEPFCYSPQEACSAHSANEKISISNLKFGIRFLVEMVENMDKLEIRNQELKSKNRK
jgi:acetylornithine deacetylase/succinyl-diaminopimelate desuccinylase-like protein